MPKSIQTPQPITETLEYLQGIFEHIEQEQPTAEQIQKLIKVAKAPLQYAVSLSTEQIPQTANQQTHNERITDVEQALNKSEPSQATLIPLYGVYCNGEPIFITGSIQTAHPKRIAHDIKSHLEAVTDDEYTLEVIQWVEESSSGHHTGLCEIARNGEIIRLNQSVPTYYSPRTAHEIVLHLEALTEDEYSIINHQIQDEPVSEPMYTPVSYTDKWEVQA